MRPLTQDKQRGESSDFAIQPIVAFDSLPGVKAGFLGRHRGYSQGAYASLNFGLHVGDAPGAVLSNWRLLENFLAPARGLVRLRQVHGSRVNILSDYPERDRVYEGDGAVTKLPGLFLTVLTADCVPVLLVDPVARVVAAFHAGWRGILAGVVDSSVRAMESLGTCLARSAAALGPAIGFCCFEVDEALAHRFRQQPYVTEAHWRRGLPGKAYLDLRAIIARALALQGIPESAIVANDQCTRCMAERFFSRRAAGGNPTGLQLSFIGLETPG